MKKANWRKQIDLYLLGATAVLSIVISFLDFFGLLEKIPWLNLDISTLSLLLLGTVALFLAIERRNFLEGIEEELNSGMNAILTKSEENTRHIIDSLSGVAVRRFDKLYDGIAYSTQRLSEAKISVDDTSVSPIVGLDGHLPQNVKKSVEYRNKTALVAQKIPYREIFLFNRPTSTRYEKLRMRLDENAPGYSCAYYANPPEMPLLQFMIVDGEEVIFISDQYKTSLAIRHPIVVQLFKEYYEEIWKNATIIKLSTKINQNVVDKIFSGWQDKK